MISIIVCSRSNDVFKVFEENLRNTIGLPCEIIRIDNSLNEHTIFTAYNLGASRSTMSYLCFVHEDVHFHTKNWGNKIIEHLEKPNTGIIGIAGSPTAGRIPAPWTWNQKYVNIIQSDRKNNQQRAKQVKIPSDNQSAALPCVLLDGVFLCVKKELMSKISFDENFTGFHGYDMDISLQSHLLSYSNFVVYDILLEHFSRGRRDKTYYQNLLKLYNKWENKLPLHAENYNHEEFLKLKRGEKLRLKRLIIKLYAANFEMAELERLFAYFSEKINPGNTSNTSWLKLLPLLSKLLNRKRG